MRREILLAVVTRTVSLSLSLAGTYLSVRALSVDERGQYYYAQAIAATVGQMTNPGLQYSNTYFGLKDRSKWGGVLGNSLAVPLLLTSGVSLTVNLGLHAWGGMQSFPFPLVVSSAGLASLALLTIYGQQLLLALENQRAYFWGSFIYDVCNFLAILLTFLYFRNAFALTALLLVSGTLVNLGLWSFLIAESPSPVRFDFQLLKESASYSMRSFWACLSMGFFSRMQIFLAKRFYSDSQVGVISLAAQLSDLLQIVPMTFGAMLFPKLVKAEGSRVETTRRSMMVVGGLTGIASLALALVAPTLIPMVFGPQYQGVAAHLQWMLPGSMFAAMVVVLVQYYASIGQPRIGITVTVLNILIYFSLATWGVGVWGPAGLAATHSIANLTMLVCLWWFSGSLRRPKAQPAQDEAISEPLVAGEGVGSA
jgi:O-antigen/teichoic acid export membrane protein